MTAVNNIIAPVLAIEHGIDRTLAILPFYHIYGSDMDLTLIFNTLTTNSYPGATNLLQYPIQQGVPVIVMSKFEPEAFCRNIEKYQITFGLIVPPVLVVLTRHPGL